MTKVIIFEGRNEIIIGFEKEVKNIKRLWFIEGGRDIEEYDIYTCDAKDGFSIHAPMSIDTVDALEDYKED